MVRRFSEINPESKQPYGSKDAEGERQDSDKGEFDCTVEK
jgi:hypothetical protein